jgi:glycosyltransferase involved in cell wall biosynthesis
MFIIGINTLKIGPYTRLSIVGTVGVPASYGGFETLVENLLSEKEHAELIKIYCSSKHYSQKVKTYKNSQLIYIPLNANGVQSIPYDIWSLFHAAISKSDNILLLGVSGAISLPFLRLFSKAKIITNIDGLEWKRAKWNIWAKRFLKFSEKVAVKYSDVVIADNKGIADYVKQEYNVKAEVIAYGGDHAIIKELSISDDGFALALCRIEPENNVELILESFSNTNKALKFIGNWGNSEFGCLMKAKYNNCSNIEIIDPIYDINKLFEIRQRCSFYVHGHSAGGTNPSLVEMMHFGKTIFAFDCNYNRASTEDRAEFFLDSKGLIGLIENSISSENAGNMKEIAQRRYTWDIVKQQYFDLFK